MGPETKKVTDLATETNQELILVDLDTLISLIGIKDGSTGSFVSIDFPHHEAHEGDSFISDAVSGSLGLNDTLSLAFKTPDSTKLAHIIFGLVTKAAGHICIIEGASWDNQSGSLNPIFNRRRESLNNSILLEDSGQATFTATDNIILDPTNITGGTEIHDLYTFQQQNTTFERRDDREFILKPDTTYVFQYVADSGANAGQIILIWYEHTDI